MNFKDHADQKLVAGHKIGILLTNLGTPDAPSTSAVRRYLAEFLSDPRVVETPRAIWMFILHGIILRTRPKRSAAAYAEVWDEEGSPLLSISKKQATGLQSILDELADERYQVVLAMRYGNPSITKGLEKLRQGGCNRILVLPLYPQYSATTSASTFDAVSNELQKWRWLPDIRFITHYPTYPPYIQALATSIRAFWDQHGKADKLLFSFHGIPQSYADSGDPYPEECRATAEAVAERLGLDESEWQLAFQSRMGKKPWIKPYTDITLQALGQQGTQSINVICPGFPTDCLETLEEIAIENQAYFHEAGGGEYRYIPALNTSKAHIEMLAELATEQTLGW
jgi:ferrochelatase